MEVVYWVEGSEVDCSRPSFVSRSVDRGLGGTEGKMVKISPRDLRQRESLFEINSSCRSSGGSVKAAVAQLEVKPHLVSDEWSCRKWGGTR